MDVTKPYEFIRFGAMDVTKPYKFIRFGAGMASKLYIYIYINCVLFDLASQGHMRRSLGSLWDRFVGPFASMSCRVCVGGPTPAKHERSPARFGAEVGEVDSPAAFQDFCVLVPPSPGGSRGRVRIDVFHQSLGILIEGSGCSLRQPRRARSTRGRLYSKCAGTPARRRIGGCILGCVFFLFKGDPFRGGAPKTTKTYS
jgi:hypothetical protein